MHDKVLTLIMDDLQDFELASCLWTVLHLMKLNYISSIEPAIIDKITRVTVSHESSNQLLIPALAVLCQILFTRNADFNSIKQKVRKSAITLNYIKNAPFNPIQSFHTWKNYIPEQ